MGIEDNLGEMLNEEQLIERHVNNINKLIDKRKESYNYVRVERLTEWELRQQYKKMRKSKLIDMLIENNRINGMIKI